MRLTPFPISSRIDIEAKHTSSTVNTESQISNYRHGPLDVPTQHQRRSKREAAPLAFLLTPTECEVLVALQFSAVHEACESVSVLVISQSAGRAPPLLS